MNWDWLTEQPRELAHLPPAERRELVRAGVRRMRRRWRALAELLGYAVAMPLIALVPLLLDRRPQGPAFFAVSAAQLAIAGWLAARSLHHRRHALRDELLARNIRPAYCFDCGYDVGGTPSPVCTECGARLEAEPLAGVGGH